MGMRTVGRLDAASKARWENFLASCDGALKHMTTENIEFTVKVSDGTTVQLTIPAETEVALHCNTSGALTHSIDLPMISTAATFFLEDGGQISLMDDAVVKTSIGVDTCARPRLSTRHMTDDLVAAQLTRLGLTIV